MLQTKATEMKSYLEEVPVGQAEAEEPIKLGGPQDVL
jgi:hypothetical protein